MFDWLFDCLNVRDYNQWKEKRKPDLKPHSRADDERLNVGGNFMHGLIVTRILLHVVIGERFLGYLKEWKTAVEGEKKLTADENRRMLLSQETMEGLEITGTVYIHMYMHSIYLHITVLIHTSIHVRDNV